LFVGKTLTIKLRTGRRRLRCSGHNSRYRPPFPANPATRA
jgi:hypothetical protein